MDTNNRRWRYIADRIDGDVLPARWTTPYCMSVGASEEVVGMGCIMDRGEVILTRCSWVCPHIPLVKYMAHPDRIYDPTEVRYRHTRVKTGMEGIYLTHWYRV